MNSSTVNVKQGQLRGFLGDNYNGEKFHKFLGIPYAKPPVGDLRFKSPVPADGWTGVRDATEEGDRCYSREWNTLQPGGSEDCLYLNVFTKQLPQSNDSELRPVMVWIHGGAFNTGSSTQDIYGPEFLLIEDVVVVTINYRLGVLGFLSLEDSSLGVPGNAGLKDQVLAIKWVKDNIKHFGGDPGNITIFGESAGAASVHYHIISPLSKGLFQRAILQSGSVLNPWAMGTHDPLKLVEKLNATAKNEEEALDVLRKAPVDQLFAAQESYIADSSKPAVLIFTPVVESASAEDPFITKNPLEIILSGDYNQVPLIFGYTNMEGMLFEVMKLRIKDLPPTKPPTLEEVIPWHLKVDEGSDLSKVIQQKWLETYFKGPDLAANLRLLMTDQAFVVGIIASVLSHAKTSKFPVYLYRLTLETSLNFYKKLCNAENIPGVCHADDLGYLFKNFVTPEKISAGSDEDKSIRRFVKLWTSFAKHGKFDQKYTGLQIDWKPASANEINFLNIDKELSTDVDPEHERISIWRDIYRLSNSDLVNNYF